MYWPSIIALALTAAAPAPAAPYRIPTKVEIKGCPGLAKVDWKAVKKALKSPLTSVAAEPDRWEGHKRIRGPRPLPDLSRAEIVLDVYVGSGETQETPTSTSSIVWREPGGEWQLDRVDDVTAAPDPMPPGSGVVMDEAWNALAHRPLSEGPLEEPRAKQLDGIFNDPCFALQPDYPLWKLSKKEKAEHCSDFGHSVRVQTGNRVRYVSNFCRLGYGHELPNLVMYADLGFGTYFERAIAKRLPLADLKLTELKGGRRPADTIYLCGTAESPGKGPARFVYYRWYGGGYWRERLLFTDDGPDFNYYSRSYCGAPAAS